MTPFESSDEAWRTEMHRLLVGLPATADAVVAHWHARPEFHRPRGPIKLQAKHIPDELFLWLTWAVGRGCWFPGVGGGYDSLMMPEKVVRAKAAALIRRGLLTGCACGCRGNLEITGTGQALVELAAAAGHLTGNPPNRHLDREWLARIEQVAADGHLGGL